MIDKFKQSMDRSGLSTKNKIIADGCLHRFHVIGDKPGSRNGWFVLFDGSIPAGAYGSWKTGEKHSWCSKSQIQYSSAEKAVYKRQMQEIAKARNIAQQNRYDTASRKALEIWRKSSIAEKNYPYLLSKKVQNHGLRLYKLALVVPIRDYMGKLWSLQFINNDGTKRFLSSGKIQGCYLGIGKLRDTICIAEGYATGASIYEATGHAVAVAFNAGNMKAVALAIRAKYPTLKIILCADNDTKTKGNPGVTKAREAALSVEGLMVIAGDI